MKALILMDRNSVKAMGPFKSLDIENCILNTVPSHNRHIFVRPKRCAYYEKNAYLECFFFISLKTARYHRT